ncbi:MAG: hypothetical protein OSJ76_07180 [Alphaproteobacteria bacterium]|nr:hypothetical protein [Alphaproteobacteria bacterium]
MEKKIISAAIAVVAAVIIYFGGWEIIKFIGSNVFEFPWNSAAILLLSLCTIVLMFCTVCLPYKIYLKLINTNEK